MSWSLAGRALCAPSDRTKRCGLRVRPFVRPMPDPIASRALRPRPERTCAARCGVRRAAPSNLRQLPAAVSRSDGLSSNCTSFSASANVEGETGGPASGAVPKAGGLPAGRPVESAAGLRQATSDVMSTPDERLRNLRRVSDMFILNIVMAPLLVWRRFEPTRCRVRTSVAA